jgi:hypothetical protein
MDRVLVLRQISPVAALIRLGLQILLIVAIASCAPASPASTVSPGSPTSLTSSTLATRGVTPASAASATIANTGPTPVPTGSTTHVATAIVAAQPTQSPTKAITTATPGPLPTRTLTPVAQNPNCLDWRDGQDHGWKKAAWTGGGVTIQFTKQGMLEVANQNGEWDGGAWWQLMAKDSPLPGPSTPYQVQFIASGGDPTRVFVWQAADDPDNKANVEQLKPDGSGNYTLTKPYVGLSWRLPTPPSQAGPVIIYTFCYSMSLVL